jgi:pyruvate kinase
MDRRTKIMATLGPASREEATLSELFLAGADVVRLNLSHGSHEEHRELIRTIRRVSTQLDRHVPILLDLMGPRYRLAWLPARRNLVAGARVRLGLSNLEAEVPVEKDVLEHLQPGERLLIDNGIIELEIEEKTAGQATARVVVGGAISSRKGINLPDSRLPFTVSDKDRADIAFAVAEEVDFLGASYVGGAEDVEAIRAEVRRAGGEIPVVAKLERARAIERLEKIVAASEALMVARGDLGVEVPLHRVPVLQKRILETGRRAGRPVTVATQMLESMVEQPRPTRAEATDVATAVAEGADALMLSTETAAGRHPVEAVRTMDRIIRETEAYLAEREDSSANLLALPLPDEGESEDTRIPDVVSAAAVLAARRLDVPWIAAFSQGGFTARLVARYRPSAGILVFTPDPRVARRVQLLWGARPVIVASRVEQPDQVARDVEHRLVEMNLAEPGDAVVIVMGDPVRDQPLTNLLRVGRVGKIGDALPESDPSRGA